jgi:DNA polymerase III subunit gamma/tau
MNFSRRLRPKVFEEIVGQDLVKSMLKNSLFLDKIFPAYLFAGQRGCGKTTTARVFAKSLNCQLLSSFRNDPKVTVFPCLTCTSCLNMEALSHPDFLELDAASNNGVENIRQIIETTFYQPVLGVKRVFLIDEAHMLSKAAFNALLKILEEPPKTVTFILATTELEKIPLTIRSRAFLGLFPCLLPRTLFDYLVQVCTTEGLVYEEEALWFLVRQSQGCLRDALNLLEQVFFCQPKITLEVTQQVFSYCPAESVVELCGYVFSKQKKAILEFFAKRLQMYTASSLFEMLQSLWVEVLNSKLGVASQGLAFYGFEKPIATLARDVEELFLRRSMRLLWDNQRAFSLVSQKDFFLQYLLIELCDDSVSISSETKVSSARVTAAPAVATRATNSNSATDDVLVSKNRDVVVLSIPVIPVHTFLPGWQEFLDSASVKKQRLLHVTLSSATNVVAAPLERQLLVYLPRVNGFVDSLIEESGALIKIALAPFFEDIDKISVKQDDSAKVLSSNKKVEKFASVSNRLDFSNEAEWPKVNLIVKHFPGTVSVEYKKR